MELARIMEPRVKSNVSFDLNLPEQSIIIFGDQNRIAQVLMNLISNALKFTDQGKVEVTLSLGPNNEICVEILDTGIGISEDKKHLLFKEFSQVTKDSKRNMEGTGLGLAISKGILQQMKGYIEFESEENKGSTFRVVLPEHFLSVEPINTVSTENQLHHQIDISQINILVVDDIAMNCTVLEEMLISLGAQHVVSLNSAKQALDYVAENPLTELILMDMRMPEMDGIEATKLIRRQKYLGKIVAVTANASSEDKSQCLAAGMDEFVSKPIDIDSLVKVLAKITLTGAN